MMFSSENTNAVNVRGRLITQHRSLRHIHFSRYLVLMTLLPASLSCLTWWQRDAIVKAWETVCLFWVDKLELIDMTKLSDAPRSTLFASTFANIDLVTHKPDGIIWWATLVVTVVVLFGSKFMPDRALPLRYLVRIMCFIQATALVFFAVVPQAFPYNLSAYVGSSMQAGLWLLLLIPWVHALVFYIFGFSFLQKIFLTLLTMGLVAVVLPMQLMVHAYLIVKGSLLLLPLLYFLFGTSLLIFVCVALYGWAMSWQGKHFGGAGQR